MKGYISNIEKETRENDDYRRVLYTGKNSQLVLMNVQPGDDIGSEVHSLDQFIRIEAGSGEVHMDNAIHPITDGSAFIIPAGMEHNVINTCSVEMKLYSIYSPPEHKEKTVHKTKAEAAEEHFDGTTTE